MCVCKRERKRERAANGVVAGFHLYAHNQASNLYVFSPSEERIKSDCESGEGAFMMLCWDSLACLLVYIFPQ